MSTSTLLRPRPGVEPVAVQTVRESIATACDADARTTDLDGGLRFMPVRVLADWAWVLTEGEAA